MYLAICFCYPHEQAGVITPGTRRLNRKFAKPIFSVRIYVVCALSAFIRSLCIFSLVLLRDPNFASVGRGMRFWYVFHLESQCSLMRSVVAFVCFSMVWLVVVHFSRCAGSGVDQGGGDGGIVTGASLFNILMAHLFQLSWGEVLRSFASCLTL